MKVMRPVACETISGDSWYCDCPVTIWSTRGVSVREEEAEAGTRAAGTDRVLDRCAEAAAEEDLVSDEPRRVRGDVDGEEQPPGDGGEHWGREEERPDVAGALDDRVRRAEGRHGHLKTHGDNRA